jgi:hypothetical protein
MTTSKTNKQTRLLADEKLRDGYTKHLAGAGNIVVASKDHTPADVQADIQARIDADNASEVARGAFHGAVADAAAVRQRTAAIVEAVKQLALIRFADQPEVLAEFGLKPKKPRRPRTVQEKLDAVQKNLNTRTARHTAGPRQRAKIKGGATPPLPTPEPTPVHAAPTPLAPSPAPAAPVAPAPTPSPGGGNGHA